MIRQAQAELRIAGHAHVRRRSVMRRIGPGLLWTYGSIAHILPSNPYVRRSPQPDWPPNVLVTGHIFHDAPHGASPPPEMESFLDEGPRPVGFTLASSVVMVAGDFWRESIAAARRVRARAILLTGPGNAAALRPSLPPEILAVDVALHSLLFPLAAAVVQQCGIGTTAQSLLSGRPMLAVPYAHDQPDNAWRAARFRLDLILDGLEQLRSRVTATCRRRIYVATPHVVGRSKRVGLRRKRLSHSPSSPKPSTSLMEVDAFKSAGPHTSGVSARLHTRRHALDPRSTGPRNPPRAVLLPLT